MSDVWYYAQGDKSVGPVTLAELMAVLSRVAGAKDVLVWRASSTDWVKAEEIPELSAVIVKPPPLPSSIRTSKLPAVQSTEIDDKSEFVPSKLAHSDLPFTKPIRTAIYVVAILIGIFGTIILIRNSNLQGGFPSSVLPIESTVLDEAKSPALDTLVGASGSGLSALQSGQLLPRTSLAGTNQGEKTLPNAKRITSARVLPEAQAIPEIQQTKNPAAGTPVMKLLGQCMNVTVLGVNRGQNCNINYVKYSNRNGAFFVSITPNGIVRGFNEPLGPDDTLVIYAGYPTGLIGGIDPVKASSKVLNGILKIGAPRSDPRVLYNIGEYFFVILRTEVIQKRELFTTVREKLAPVTLNEGGVHLTWDAAGYCRGIRLPDQNGTWSLECQVTPNSGNTNRFQFISADPIGIIE